MGREVYQGPFAPLRSVVPTRALSLSSLPPRALFPTSHTFSTIMANRGSMQKRERGTHTATQRDRQRGEGTPAALQPRQKSGCIDSLFPFLDGLTSLPPLTGMQKRQGAPCGRSKGYLERQKTARQTTTGVGDPETSEQKKERKDVETRKRHKSQTQKKTRSDEWFGPLSSASPFRAASAVQDRKRHSTAVQTRTSACTHTQTHRQWHTERGETERGTEIKRGAEEMRRRSTALAPRQDLP